MTWLLIVFFLTADGKGIENRVVDFGQDGTSCKLAESSGMRIMQTPRFIGARCVPMGQV